jgi:hypothetical protein
MTTAKEFKLAPHQYLPYPTTFPPGSRQKTIHPIYMGLAFVLNEVEKLGA